MFADIAWHYRWRHDDIMRMSVEQLRYYQAHIPRHRGKEAWPLAEIHAEIRNFLSPRYLDPDPNPPKEPPRRIQPWLAKELLPPDAINPFGQRIPSASAALLFEHREELPPWALELIDWADLPAH